MTSGGYEPGFMVYHISIRCDFIFSLCMPDRSKKSVYFSVINNNINHVLEIRDLNYEYLWTCPEKR